ncbi:MAG: hypothetical protein ACHQFX_20665 [Chitinophagales bacterium]
MSLNDIQLPVSTIAELYHLSLIEDNEVSADTAANTNATDAQKHLGDNNKNILIVVDYADLAFLPDEELSFLTKLLAACKLSLADVAIVNMNNHKEKTYKELISTFKSRIVFLFGIEPASFGLPVSFPHFQIQPFTNATFLFTPTLDQCNKDALLKSKLWVCLRRIFVV